MMPQVFYRCRKSYPILIVLFLTACGQGNVGDGQTTPVSITMRIPSSTPRLSSTPAGLNSSFAPAPSPVASVSISVTDVEGRVLASENRFVTPGQIVTIDLEVPSGPARTFTAQAKNADGMLLFQGQSAPVDLEPSIPKRIAIEMRVTATTTTTTTIPTTTITTTTTMSTTTSTTTTTTTLPATFKLTLLGGGPTGTAPLPGVRIIRHDPTTGAVLGDLTTDANGVADFGDIETSRTSFSIIGGRTGISTFTEKRTFTFLNMPTGNFTFNEREDFDRSTLTTVDVTLTNLPAGTTQAQLFTGGFNNQGAGFSGSFANFTGFTVAQLQSDLKFSLLGIALDSNRTALGCGSSIDLDPAIIGPSFAVDAPPTSIPFTAAVDAPPTSIPFTASEPVISGGFRILRKGVVFDAFQQGFGQGFGSPVSFGNLQVCSIPGAEGFELSLRTLEATSISSKSKEISNISPTLPGSLNVTLPNLSIDSFSHSADGKTIGWTRSGTDLSKLDFASTQLGWVIGSTGYSWSLVAPETTTNITIPGLPVDLSDRVPPTTGVSFNVELGGLDTANGFDDLLQKLSAANDDFDTFKFSATEFVRVTLSVQR